MGPYWGFDFLDPLRRGSGCVCVCVHCKTGVAAVINLDAKLLNMLGGVLLSMWGFPKIRGAILGSHKTRIIVF